MPTEFERIGNALGAISAHRLEQQRIFSGGQDTNPLNPEGYLFNAQGVSNKSDGRLFLESALSASPFAPLIPDALLPDVKSEIFGSRPSRDVERYRAENPIGGTVSWLAGSLPFFLLPAAAPVRAASSLLPGFTRGLLAADRLKNAGSLFKAGALREATIFAPLEAARVAGSAFNPEEGSTFRTLSSAGSELAFLGVGAGALSSFAGRTARFKAERLRNTNSESEAAFEFEVAKHIGPAFDRNAPDQIKLAFMQENLGKYKDNPVITGQMERLIDSYKTNIKVAEPPPNPIKNGTRYVAFLGNKKNTLAVESLYRGGKEGGPKAILSKKLARSDTGEGTFKTVEELNAATAEWEEIARDAGLKDNWHTVTQYVRKLIPTSDKSKDRLIRTLTDVKGPFNQVEPNGWLARESSDGLYIGIKRLPHSPKGSYLERAKERLDPYSGNYFIFKTNNPTKWFPKASGVYETNAKAYNNLQRKWYRSKDIEDARVPILNMIENKAGIYNPAQQSLFTGKTRFSTDPNVPAEVGKLRLMVERFLPQEVREASQPTLNYLSEAANVLRIVAAPSRLQGGQNPRLSMALMFSKDVFDTMQAMVNDHLLGRISRSFQGQGNPVGNIFRTALNPTARREGGILQSIEKGLGSSEKALDDFFEIRMTRMPIEEAKAKGLHPEAIRVAEEMEKGNKFWIDQVADQAQALGTETTFVPQEGHLGLAQQWIGPFRARIVEDSTGVVRGYGSGYTREQARKDAIEIIEALNNEAKAAGKPKLFKTYGDQLTDKDILHAGSVEFKAKLPIDKFLERTGIPTDVSSSQADIFGFAADLDLRNPLVQQISKFRAQMFRNDPIRFKRSKGLLGGRLSQQRANKVTIDEIKANYAAGVTEMGRYLAREGIAVGPMQEQLSRLANEDSASFVTLARILNSYSGASGPIAAQLDGLIDTALADYFGPGVAQRAVKHVNEAMFTLTLGALDMGFAALNLITPLQTAIPEVSYLLNAAPEMIQKYYSSVMVKTTDGGLRPVRFMDTWKFARESMGKLWRPDASDREALQWAFDTHTVGRDFVETVHGPSRSLTQGQGGFWDNLRRISEAPVVATEEASRAYSFMLGRQVAKDFFLMGENEARVFAKEFVNNTMFGYSAADRPRMLTGAIGAGWGLFKNWTANYTGNLARYTAEASRGNFGPLAWTFGTAGAVGGLSAVPLAGAADSMSRFLSDKPLSDLVYDWVGNDPGDTSKPWLADMMMHGFFSNLGFTLRSRASLPSSHLATDLVMFSNISILDRFMGLGDLVGTGIEDIKDFRIPLQNPKFRREMLKAFAPRTLQRAMTSFGEMGVTSLNSGNTLLPALNAFEGTFRSLGLTPTRVANAFEVHQNARYDAEKKREAIQRLGRRWADAELNRDWREVQRIVNEAAWEYAVPIDSVQRSADARIRNMTQTVTQRQYEDYVTQRRLEMRGLRR